MRLIDNAAECEVLGLIEDPENGRKYQLFTYWCLKSCIFCMFVCVSNNLYNHFKADYLDVLQNFLYVLRSNGIDQIALAGNIASHNAPEVFQLVFCLSENVLSIRNAFSANLGRAFKPEGITVLY